MDAHGAQTRYDVMLTFTLIFIFRILRFFYVKMATSQEGGGVSAYPYLRNNRVLIDPLGILRVCLDIM